MDLVSELGKTQDFDISIIWTIVKWAYVLAAAFYVMFALVVLSQVRQMVAALRRQFNVMLIGLAWVHLGFAVMVLLLALFGL